MTVLDANGREVPHERCACGRWRQAVDASCCRPCGTGRHTSSCNIRQESFPDTRRGVFVSDGERFRVHSLGRGVPVRRPLPAPDPPMRGSHLARVIEHKGCRLSVLEWSRQTGIPRTTIYSRLRAGWSVDRALTETLHRTRPRP